MLSLVKGLLACIYVFSPLLLVKHVRVIKVSRTGFLRKKLNHHFAPLFLPYPPALSFLFSTRKSLVCDSNQFSLSQLMYYFLPCISLNSFSLFSSSSSYTFSFLYHLKLFILRRSANYKNTF